MATPLTTITPQAIASHLAQVFAQYPIEVAHGDGVWLHARDGRKILDFYGGHAVAGLGYGHPRWLAALEKWYGFPRTPFDVRFAPRDKPASIERFVDKDTAAVIVEPVQGVGGAYDVGKPMLDELRRRCDEAGAFLIFDEVQCGTGRTGAPFAANFHGVVPDMLTAAKALGNGFPVSALLLSRRIAAQLKHDDMGTTFGGGPMACAVAEAVIDTIESESLLANVRQVSAYIRSSCVIGPVTGVQGAGFLLGLKTSRPAKEVQAALLAKNILTGTSADPHILRLLPAYILNEGHVDRLSDALAKISA